jgi:hypothetical protein
MHQHRRFPSSVRAHTHIFLHLSHDRLPQYFAWGGYDIRGNCASTAVVDSDAITLLASFGQFGSKGSHCSISDFLHSTFLGVLTTSVIQSYFIMDASSPPSSQSTPSKRPPQEPSRSTTIVVIPSQPSTPTAHQQQHQQQYQQPVNTPTFIMRSMTDISSS